MTPPSCELCERPPMSGRGLCSRCSKGVGRERGHCRECGKTDRLLDAHRRCRWCRDKARNRCPDCEATGTALVSINGVRVCDRCALRRRLDHILPADRFGPLHLLRDVIVRAEPLTARRWLNRSEELLRDLDTGRIPLTHESLDDLPQRKAIEHLRSLLIAADILGPDPGRALRHLENAIPDLLAPLAPEHRRLASRWATWAVLPRLRALNDDRRLATAVINSRRKIGQTANFLAGLEDDGRVLPDCTQHDIDMWFAGPGAARWSVGPFLTWARRRGHLPRSISLPPAYKGTPEAPAEADERWQIAQRLVRDDELDPVDRIAGALIVLYAQPLARIVTLTTEDVIVTPAGTRLKLGDDALELPEPFAATIQQLPHRRRASTLEQLPTRWLFTGGHADKPLSVNALAVRMRAIGIQPRRHRIAAAEQLVREIPPAMLAGVLGLTIGSINRHTTTAKGQWATYAADRQG